MEHVFEDLEVAIAFVEDFEAFESHKVAMEGVAEREVVDFGQICDSSLIKNSQRESAFRAGFRLLDLQVLGGNEIRMLVSGVEGLKFPIDVFLGMDDFLILHDFFCIVGVTVNRKWGACVQERVVFEGREVGGEFLLTVGIIAHF
jgi:hypothetical protein